MKKKFCASVILLLTAALLFSCGKGETPPAVTGATGETATATAETASTETEEETKVEMTAVPGLSAETVDFYGSSDVNYRCFAAKKDGVYRFIDGSGAAIHDRTAKQLDFGMLVTDPATGYDGKWCLFASDGEIWESGSVVKEDGFFLDAPRYGTGFVNWAKVYWTEAGPELIVGDGLYSERVECTYLNFSKNTFTGRTGYMSYDGEGGGRVIPVQKATAMELVESPETGPSVRVTLASEKYGLFNFDTGKMVTGFLYDECTSFAVDGVFAVKIDGKWGYVDEEGREITKPVFDASHVEEYLAWNDETNASYIAAQDEMFLPLNGCIVTRQGDKFGLIRKDGPVLLEPSYDYLSQVNGEGVFFALQNGVWYRGTVPAK